jgi:hypothetical protein
MTGTRAGRGLVVAVLVLTMLGISGCSGPGGVIPIGAAPKLDGVYYTDIVRTGAYPGARQVTIDGDTLALRVVGCDAMTQSTAVTGTISANGREVDWMVGTDGTGVLTVTDGGRTLTITDKRGSHAWIGTFRKLGPDEEAAAEKELCTE